MARKIEIKARIESVESEARGDILLLHRIFHAIKRPLVT